MHPSLSTPTRQAGAADLRKPHADRELSGRDATDADGSRMPPAKAAGRARTLRRLAVAAGLAFLLVLGLRLSLDTLFDAPPLLALNLLAGQSELFDHLLRSIDRFNLFQGVAIYALAFAAYGATRAWPQRAQLVLGCTGAAAAAAAGRLLQSFLPHAPRPLFDPDLPFRAPHGADVETLRDWSSFPSDHATLLFGVSCAIWVTNRTYGGLAFGLAAIAAIARNYGGLHYPTDSIGGGLLGCAVVLLFASAPQPTLTSIGAVIRRHQPIFAGAAFFFAAQSAYLFDDVRQLTSGVVAYLLNA